MADGFAKHACLKPVDEDILVAEGKVEINRRYSFWVTPAGGDKLNPKDVKGAVREYRQAELSKGEKVDNSVAIHDGTKQSKETQVAAFWGSGTEGVVRKIVIRARYGRWATRNNLCLWFNDIHTCAICTICDTREVETPAHLLLSCKHEEVHPQHISRHTHYAVKSTVTTLKRKSKGGYVGYDTTVAWLGTIADTPSPPTC